jgi:hypothetical protein
MKLQYFLFSAILFLSSKQLLAQDHGHLNVGAISPGQGAALDFDNGAAFSEQARYVSTLTFTNGGRYANLYQGNITLTALHSVDAFGDPVPGGPAPGSFIVAEIAAVNGPEGGEFQFWETNSTTEAAAHIPSGSTNVGFHFELSEAGLGAGQPGGDPFGHIHGRRFAATAPGIYTVYFRAIDTSTNGAGGGPIHAPSDLLGIQFEAGVNLASVTNQNGSTQITFAAPAGYSWQLQSTTNIANPEWIDVASPVIGADAFVDVIDGAAPGPRKFFRAVGNVYIP